MPKNKPSSRIRKFPTTLVEQARVFGYRRFVTEKDWEIELPLPPGGVRRLFLNAIGMAALEGPMVGHAHSLEAVLPYLRPNFKYKVGRTAEGCTTVYIGP